MALDNFWNLKIPNWLFNRIGSMCTSIWCTLYRCNLIRLTVRKRSCYWQCIDQRELLESAPVTQLCGLLKFVSLFQIVFLSFFPGVDHQISKSGLILRSSLGIIYFGVPSEHMPPLFNEPFDLGACVEFHRWISIESFKYCSDSNPVVMASSKSFTEFSFHQTAPTHNLLLCTAIVA